MTVQTEFKKKKAIKGTEYFIAKVEEGMCAAKAFQTWR